MSENEMDVLPNPELLTTRELQKRQRQAAYAAAKAKRRADRAAEKAAIREKKAEIRCQRDAELWQSLRTASAENADADSREEDSKA